MFQQVSCPFLQKFFVQAAAGQYRKQAPQLGLGDLEPFYSDPDLAKAGHFDLEGDRVLRSLKLFARDRGGSSKKSAFQKVLSERAIAIICAKR